MVYKGILFDKQNKNQPSIVAVKTISGKLFIRRGKRFTMHIYNVVYPNVCPDGNNFE